MDLEICLLGGVAGLERLKSIKTNTDAQAEQKLLAEHILNGRFESVLASLPAQHLLKCLVEDGEACEDVEAAVSQVADAAGVQSPEQQMYSLLTGVACLHLFMQANWTGPTLVSAPLVTAAVEPGLSERCVKALSIDGEAFYSCALYPYLLCAARALLRSAGSLPACTSACVWELRCAEVHLQQLDGNSATLKEAMEAAVQNVLQWADLSPEASALQRIIAGRACVEAARVHRRFWRYKDTDSAVARAMECTGLRAKVTGVLGMRTKFQREKKAQLVLRAHSELSDSEGDALRKLIADAGLSNEDVYPVNSELESDAVLLEALKLDDVSAEEDGEDAIQDSPLSTVDQATILSLSESVKLHNATTHALTHYEMEAHVVRVLSENPASWAVRMQALYQRSKLQGRDNHLSDRAVCQLEQLVAAVRGSRDAVLGIDAVVSSQPNSATAAPGAGPDACCDGRAACDAAQESKKQTPGLSTVAQNVLAIVRVDGVHAAGLMPIWRMKLALADTLSRLGLQRSALHLFEEVGLWNRIIPCYIAIGRKAKAAELVEAQLAIKRDPELVCLLGDVHKDRAEELYEQAWHESGCRYPRAQRSLAVLKREQGKLAEAIEHHRLALAINPVYRNEWFSMGWCAMEIGDHDTASEAFSKVVSLDPEYAEAWNNLAACHLKLKKHEPAFQALEQAVRLTRSNWKLWENYMVCAMQLKEWQKAMQAFGRLVELRGREGLDAEILGYLTIVACDAARYDRASFVVKGFEGLLVKISDKVASSPNVFAAWAQLHGAVGHVEDCIEFREKQCRASQKQGWMDAESTRKDAVSAVQGLVQAYLDHPTKDRLYSGKLYVDGVCAKMRKAGHEAVEEYAQLQECLDKVKTARKAFAAGTLKPAQPQGGAATAATASKPAAAEAAPKSKITSRWADWM